MDMDRMEHPRKGVFSKGRLVALGLVMGVLVLVGGVLVARALPGAQHQAKAASAVTNSGGGGGGCFTTTGPVCTFQGNSAFADIFSQNGCVETDGFIEAAQNVAHSPPTPKVAGTTAFVEIFEYDACADVELLDAFGQASGVNFQGDKTLNSASLNDSIVVFDFISGNSFTVTVNLTWQGIGGTSSEVDSNHFRSPGVVINNHFAGTNRDALVSGSVSVGALQVASPSPNSGGGGGGGMFGELEYANSGSVAIFHQ